MNLAADVQVEIKLEQSMNKGNISVAQTFHQGIHLLEIHPTEFLQKPANNLSLLHHGSIC
jgi:hypothetical protein